MKAFVIKNKEGKYWCGNDIFSETIDISKTYICEDFDFISKVVISTGLREGLFTTNCEVVEITIAEGDLEQENKQLKEQLAEKDEEINKLQQMAIIDMQTKEILELQVATIRKQICEELRNKVGVYNGMISNVEELLKFREILDQIEQEGRI